MFDFFKKDTETQPKDVKSLREELLRFIKVQLQQFEGGEGSNIKSLQLYLVCEEAEKHVYESMVYYDEVDRFKDEEVQKIADDYAIALPAGWTMEISFVDSLPPDAIKVPNVDAALFIQTKKRSIQKTATAYVKVLNGEAEKAEYSITSASGKVNIGREKKVLAEDGFMRINNIAFPDSSGNESNKYVSRQHAHIEFDNETGTFLLFADEGGVPPRNKIKVRQQHNANLVKLHTTEIGHKLQEGDQIMLGESALLQFSYLSDEI